MWSKVEIMIFFIHCCLWFYVKSPIKQANIKFGSPLLKPCLYRLEQARSWQGLRNVGYSIIPRTKSTFWLFIFVFLVKVPSPIPCKEETLLQREVLRYKVWFRECSWAVEVQLTAPVGAAGKKSTAVCCRAWSSLLWGQGPVAPENPFPDPSRDLRHHFVKEFA